ncbi:MAG: hypothetical protein PHC39_07975 [Proteiniphilum sp.]|nr:hypothetical protein [Proteiniphilum sp.]
MHRVLFCYSSVRQLPVLGSETIDFSDNHISLTAGKEYRIPSPKSLQARWVSDSKFVTVDQDGVITAPLDKKGMESNADIKVYISSRLLKTYHITIVNWLANQSSLEVVKLLPNYKLLANLNGTIYYSIAKSLYATNNGFDSKRFVSRLPVLPAASPPMLATPKGFILAGQKRLFWSENLIKWKQLIQVNANGIKHALDFYSAPDQGDTYVYYAEYSCINSNRHKVYRGIINSEFHQKWDVVLDFLSLDECGDNLSSCVLAARHIHVVSVDKFTGAVWIGVGDEDAHCKILFSNDHGNSFYIVGMGSQEWRTLAIWHTANYTYWNMDSHEPQKILRIKKSTLRTHISNKFSSSINADEVINHNIEIVAELHNGAMFSVCEVQNCTGDRIVLMSAAPEGCIRDMQGRVFGILDSDELNQIQVQELISLAPKNKNAKYDRNMFTQLIPELQDNDGYVYCSTRNLEYKGIVKTRLLWN